MTAAPVEDQFIELFELWPDQNLGPTFLTSYEFDPVFFERVLARELVRRGAFPLVVFVDHENGYVPTFTCSTRIRGANSEYHLVPFDAAPARFHPKVQLFAGLNAAMVGSGNLTPGGAGYNLEVFDRMLPDRDGAAVAAVRDFFRQLTGSPRARMPAAQREELLHLVPPSEDPAKTGAAVFLHSLSAPLLPQLRAQEGIEGGRRGRFFAPFHDADHRTSRQLAKDLGVSVLEIAAAREDEPPPLKKPYKSGFVEKSDATDRYLHAKVLYARGKETATLVVGSANLTYPAWSGGNVEAVVLRQSTKPKEFEGWVSGVGFVPANWSGAAQPDEEAPTKEITEVRRLQLYGAQLSSRRLRIFVGDMPHSVRYWLEDGRRQRSLDVDNVASSEVVASLADLPKNAFVVRASAKGFEDARVWVHRPELTAVSPRMRAVSAALQGDGAEDHAVQHDLMNCVVELFARLRARSKVLERPNTPAATGSAVSNRAEEEDDDVATGAEPWMEHVEEIILERPLSQGGLAGCAPRILKAISVALGLAPDQKKGKDAGEPWGQEGDDETPEASLINEFDTASDSGRATAPSPASDGAKKRDRDWDDLARRMVDKLFEAVHELIGSRRQDAIVAYDVLLQLLEELAENSSSLREEALRRRLRLVSDAFGTSAWPNLENGWATSGAGAPDELASLMSLLRATAELRERFTDHDCEELDDAHRCLASMRVRKGTAADLLQAIVQPAGTSTLPDRLRETAHWLSSRVPTVEEARKMLEPLWSYEAALRNWQATVPRLREAEELLRNCQQKMSQTSHRSATYKSAAEVLPGALVAVSELTDQVNKARDEKDRIRSLLISAPKPAGVAFDLCAWLEDSVSRKPGKRRLALLEQGACGRCHMQVSSVVLASLNDPRRVHICAFCGVLLALGPRRLDA